ncbi:MAG: B12-binding domain-containing radical SAM protein [Chloroflexi bacterium]|nr:B12-binding domain-containing radical SAM protein [Chloroflexota bacterium]
MRLLLVETAPSSQRNSRLTAGLGYIASYVRHHIPDVVVQIIKGDPDWVRENVADFRPDIVGISTVSQYYPMAVRIADLCHERGAFVVIGGHHLSALPESMTSSMDIGVVGEGEDTMLDICRVFSNHGAQRSAYVELDGVVLQDKSGELLRSRRRALHKPLDDFPFPARDLMHIQPGESVGMITSRGCSYGCVFCASSAFWQSIRFHSAEYVVAEIKQIVEQHHTSHIYMWDDLFVADRKRVERILALLQQEPRLRRIRYSVTCRANLATDELARLLKEMNVVEAMFGLESMSPDTLAYLKPRVTVDQNREAVDVFHRNGIRVTGFFVIGSPQETREEIEQTLHFVRTAPLYRAEAYMLTPLPGTVVWNYAIERGLIDPEHVDWERLYIDNPENPENGIILSETMEPDVLRDYWRKFQRVRRRKDRINLLARIPQHITHLIRSPFEELALVRERLRTHRQGHI